MATRKPASKKKTDNLPAEFTIGGEVYRLTPKSEWTIEQDDYAIGIMAEMSFTLDTSKKSGNENLDGARITAALIKSGLYREMLGISMTSTTTKRTLEENMEHFASLRLNNAAEAFPAVIAAVTGFFGSGES